jgi:hypothetical protein
MLSKAAADAMTTTVANELQTGDSPLILEPLRGWADLNLGITAHLIR